MAATITLSLSPSTSSSYKATTFLLYCTVITVCILSQFLSVDAILCHQCNSHIDEDCIPLRLSTPHGQRDDMFLKECEGQPNQSAAFCRKTVLNIEVTGEQRIVRGCGWLRENNNFGNDSCFTADNEGYKQIICSCNTDGCNGSSDLYVSSKWTVLAVTAVSVAVAAVLRIN